MISKLRHHFTVYRILSFLASMLVFLLLGTWLQEELAKTEGNWREPLIEIVRFLTLTIPSLLLLFPSRHGSHQMESSSIQQVPQTDSIEKKAIAVRSSTKPDRAGISNPSIDRGGIYEWWVRTARLGQRLQRRVDNIELNNLWSHLRPDDVKRTLTSIANGRVPIDEISSFSEYLKDRKNHRFQETDVEEAFSAFDIALDAMIIKVGTLFVIDNSDNDYLASRHLRGQSAPTFSSHEDWEKKFSEFLQHQYLTVQQTYNRLIESLEENGLLAYGKLRHDLHNLGR